MSDTSLPKDKSKESESSLRNSDNSNETQQSKDRTSSSVVSKLGSGSHSNLWGSVVEFHYSFGYDCIQHFNLCVVDEKTLVFYSGTLIHLFYTETRTMEFRRSYSGSGIGHIVKNPKESHLAVAEKGTNPLIVIHEWPSFRVVSKLSGGTTRAYSHLGYSPDGTMLVSQGKEPDHLITVWDWRLEHIILRVKSHGQDVFNVEFSQFVPGQLTSGGLGHIKFWKMANTFTGLKLQGELGRFGQTEICDILGICALPDEKVISGSEWGNLLVWEDHLIKLEVRQKAKGNCHTAAISQIHFNTVTQDIMSVGMDGWIKLWTRATIDSADPPDEEDWYLEMQPLLELHVKDELSEAKLMSICKKNEDPDDNDWFAQDGKGGIWSLSLSEDGRQPLRLLTCHSGSVVDMAPSPLGHFLATLGQTGRLMVHDMVTKELLGTRHFQAPGTALLWLPIHVESSGAVLVGGFADGLLRLFVVSVREMLRAKRNSKDSDTSKNSEHINIIQSVKGHSAAVTTVCLNPRGSILVSGSADKTIFVHQILPKREYIVLVPVGFVELCGPVSFITWRPKQNTSAVVACGDSLVEVVLPERTLSYSSTSYNLQLSLQELKFKSVKSELIRAEELREIELKKQAKLDRKQGELNKIKADNPNLDIDEELFLMDSDDELEFPPLYYPETASPVLFVMMLPSGNLWLSMGGYDCGYLYEYSFDSSGLVGSQPVPEALSTPVHSFVFLCDGLLLVLGMANGVIRLVRCHDGVPDLTDYYDLAMHDTEHGEVHRLCPSSDGLYLYSCGTDGNVFSYTVNPFELQSPQQSAVAPKASRMTRRTSTFISGSIPKETVEDKSGEAEPSLEETKKNAEQLHQLKLNNERKNSIRRKLYNLTLKFEYILSRNKSLPESQVLPKSEFELDPRITAALQQKIEADMALMLRKTAYKVTRSRLLVKKMQNHFVDKIASLDVTVRAIKNEALRVKAFTHNNLTQEFLNAEKQMKGLLHMKTCFSGMTMDLSSRGRTSVMTLTKQSGLESMLKIQPFFHKLTLKARKALIKQNVTRVKREQRAQQWQYFLDTKPDINTDDPFDVVNFELATQSVGDFKLKSAGTYRVPEEKRITPAQKYWQLLQLHKEIYQTKEAFNVKVCNVRDSKIWLVRRFKQMYHDLDIIQRQLSPELRKQRLPVPTCYIKNNFPEHIFRLEFGVDPQIYNPVSAPYDEEYYVLRANAERPVSADMTALTSMKWQDSFTYQHLQSLGAEDTLDTPWENELKVLRMIRLLHEQDMIISEMVKGVDKFDVTLENLSIDRLKYARNIKLMEIFQLTLHQELVVINSYADREDAITQRINAGVQLRNDKLRQKILIQEGIESKQQDVVLWLVKLTDIQEEVTEKLLNNKFATFLSRLFKKKRVIKRTDDSDSESSSSGDTSDEDFVDDDNEDFIPIKLDENVCPDGCDPAIYQETINCRNLRYDTEDIIAELRKQLDDHQRELQVCNKDLAKLEVDVQATTEELDQLQFEKQQKLNNIETVVVLNLSQFRHFMSTAHPEEGLVQNPLVFHSEVLFTLAGRVRELEKETEAEEIRIKQQKMLMQRLDKRRKEMREIKKTLKKTIEEEIMRKFGEVIDIDLMEETVLKKMINQARRDYLVNKVRVKYDKVIDDLKNQVWQRTEVLIRLQRENTRRLKLQTMLAQESLKLNDILKQRDIDEVKEFVKGEPDLFENDVQQLEDILKDQLDFRNQLKEEIRYLSYKCTPPEVKKPLKPIPGKGMAQGSDHQENSETLSEDEEMRDTEQREPVEHQMSTKTITTIDTILCRLASGSSAHEVAVSLVEENLHVTADEERMSSAMEIALRLVNELIQITTKEGAGDITLVEQYTEEFVRVTQSEDELEVVDL